MIQLGDILILKDNTVLGYVSEIDGKDIYLQDNLVCVSINLVDKILRKINGKWEEIIYVKNKK